MVENTPLVIRGGRLLDAAGRRAPHTDLLVIDGFIAHLAEPGQPAPAHARVFDASGLLMHAGLINGHTHGSTNLAKATHDRWSLELLLNGAPGWAANQTLAHKALNTTIGAVEMLQKGCTTCYDLTFGFPLVTVDELIAIGKAYSDAGMRAVVAPMLQDISFYKAIPGLYEALPEPLKKQLDAEDGDTAFILRQMEEALQRWPHDKAQVRLGIAPTIPLHCSDELARGCAQLAAKYGAPLQSHVAESKVQAVAALQRWGHSLTAHFEQLGMLGPNFTVAHGVWLDDDDMRRLAAHGASVSHNPGSNMRLGAGIADSRRMLELGVNLAIGTDGALCADNQNMYEAMRYASMVSNVRGPDFNKWLTAPEVFSAATAGGARATGFDKAGTLAVGHLADIVFLDLNAINWIPLNDPANQVVLTEDATSVRHVMVGGRWVVQDGRHLGSDLSQLAQQAQAATAQLSVANAQGTYLADALEQAVGSFCIGLCRSPFHLHRYGGAPGL
ncbi:MAG: amidohydrolase family protein [Cytophagales bacterium]|nr:amidohydrolase family protein [Rhizobacter sp.]